MKKENKRHATIPVSPQVKNELKLHYRIMRGILCGKEDKYDDFSFETFVGIILGVGFNMFIDVNNYHSFITHYANANDYTPERKLEVNNTLSEYIESLKVLSQNSPTAQA